MGTSIKNDIKFNFVVREDKTEKEEEVYYQPSIDIITQLKIGDSSLHPVSSKTLKIYNNKFWLNTASIITGTLDTNLAAALDYAGYSFANIALKNSSVGVIASLAGKAIATTPEPDYTSTKLISFNHSCYDQTVIQEYIAIYSDSERLNLISIQLGSILIR